MKQIILWLMIFNFSFLTAQKSAYHQSFFEVNINNSTFSERAHLFSTEKQIKTYPELTYYWYYSNKIHQTQGGYDGKLLHGEYASFYLNSNLKEKGLFKKGLKNGTWISWFDNGKISEIRNWENGRCEGKLLVYDMNGFIVTESFYKNNLQHGVETIYKDGKSISEKHFKKGVLVSEKKKKSLKHRLGNNNGRGNNSEEQSSQVKSE